MDGNPGEWAVTFHAVSNPDHMLGGMSKLDSIFSGRKKGKMLRAGTRNAYEDDLTISHPGEKCGKGVYTSPHFSVPLRDYSDPAQNTKLHLVLQCRAKPDKIRIPESRQ